jgi:RHS repeat-associated protein
VRKGIFRSQQVRSSAWNRLAGVFRDDGNTAGQLDSADTLVAAYRYDPPSPSLRSGFGGARGLNRRIAKIIPRHDDGENPGTVTGYDRTDYLFNLDWQVLEERFEANVGTDLKDTPAEAVHVQYVWDIRYIDTPVLRIRDTAGPNGPDGALDPAVDEVVYYLTDANMNVTALVDATAGSPTAGRVVERYMYDAYGKATILNGPADLDNHPNATPPATVADWSADADQKSDLANVIFFAGYPLDPETGMYLARNRYLQPILGRWTSVDPKRYEAGMNLFAYCEDGPTRRTDPYGRDWDDWELDPNFFLRVAVATTGSAPACEAVVQAIGENLITAGHDAREAIRRTLDTVGDFGANALVGAAEVSFGIPGPNPTTETGVYGRKFGRTVAEGVAYGEIVFGTYCAEAGVTVAPVAIASAPETLGLSVAVDWVLIAGGTAMAAHGAWAAHNAWTLGEVRMDSSGSGRVDSGTPVSPSETPNSGPLHHIATNKNTISAATGGPWTPRLEPLFKKAGMTLEDGLNKIRIPGHAGPHPAGYHRAVFRRLTTATEGLSGEAYTKALQRELDAIGREAAALGSALNKLLTGG